MKMSMTLLLTSIVIDKLRVNGHGHSNGGYRGADDSTVFIDIQQTPNVPQLQGGTKRKNPHK